MKTNNPITRRGFLLTIAALAAVIVAAFTPIRSMILSRMVGHKWPRLDRSTPMGRLSDEESGTIAALIAVLVQGDHPFLLDHVARRTATEAGFLKEYRNAVRLLNQSARRVQGDAKRFEELNAVERDRALESILWRYSGDDRWMILLEKLFVSKGRLNFREFVVRDILKAFYRSGAGWRVVGYTKYPGIPAKDPLEYTRPLEK